MCLEKKPDGDNHASQKLNRKAIQIRVPRANFVDDYIFDRMAAAEIEPTPLSTDAEFLRRVMLDLTGRIPTPEQVEAFLADSRPDKRTALVDSMIGSSAFVDYWTLWLGNRFQVTSSYY